MVSSGKINNKFIKMNGKIKEIIENEMDCLITDVDFVIKKEGSLQALVNMLEEAINYTPCCTELPNEQDETEYWVDLVNWEGGGIEEVSNTNLIVFKKEIDLEIQRRLKK